MAARLRVFLTQQQDKTLLKLRTADVPQKVKDRAEVIRLNAHSWQVEKIAAHFNWTPQTVREVLHKWSNLGMEGLLESPGRGAKQAWKESDIELSKECLKNEPRTYNSLQLVQKLEKERSVKLSADRLKGILKNIWKRTRKSHRGKQNRVVQETKQSSRRYVAIRGSGGRNRLKVFR